MILPLDKVVGNCAFFETERHLCFCAREKSVFVCVTDAWLAAFVPHGLFIYANVLVSCLSPVTAREKQFLARCRSRGQGKHVDVLEYECVYIRFLDDIVDN